MKKRLVIAVGTLVLLFLFSKLLSDRLLISYDTFSSKVIFDRNGEILKISPNSQGFYSLPVGTVPKNLEKALLEKEDRYFYYHPGINPLSMARDLLTSVVRFRLSGSSTLTQQLVKILLHNEGDRSFWNKGIEAFYAISLEAHTTKEEILTMYMNVAYFGKQAQGLGEASRYYFNKNSDQLTDSEAAVLIATLGNPSFRYPGTAANEKISDGLQGAVGGAPAAEKNVLVGSARNSPESFELRSLPVECEKRCTLAIDKKLTKSLREIVERNLASSDFASAKNAAIVVLKQPENQLLAIVGTPDSSSQVNGYQINMAVEPRPIGSTIKPFIYLKAFEKGARPYSFVDDREYTYSIGTGFSIYPKNYDGKYRGLVTLHSALVNSLNVPAVKTLEYLTPPALYSFLHDTLKFKSIQPLESYDLGIALGGLEMDLLTLSHYFSLFPNQGVIKPLTVALSGASPVISAPMQSELVPAARVAPKEYVELVTKIISDRNTAVDQFGLASNLNLPFKNYALKTGTSRDFHDSWTIGYTPDFVVGVWVGNHDNTAMREVSGQSGAGKIWHEAMQLMYTTEYNKNTEFTFKELASYPLNGDLEYGLPDDDVTARQNELLKSDTAFIVSPHNEDRFQFENDITIPLKSKATALWTVDGVVLGQGTEIYWKPKRAGAYVISAGSPGKSETIEVVILP